MRESESGECVCNFLLSVLFFFSSKLVFLAHTAMKLILQRAQVIGGVGDRQLALLHDNNVWVLDNYQIRCVYLDSKISNGTRTFMYMCLCACICLCLCLLYVGAFATNIIV